MSLHRIHTRMVFGPDGQIEEDEFYWHDTEVDGPIAMAQGGGDYRLEMEERKAADKNPEQAKFTTKHGSQGVTNPAFAKYTQSYQDLQSDYQKNWAGKGVSPTEYGAMHYASYGKNEGRSLSGPKPVAKHKSTSTRTSTRASPTQPTQPIVSYSPKPVEKPKYEGPEYNPDKSITPTNIEILPVSDNEYVENRIASILDKNSPLFREAAEARVRAMAARGLGRNSSMAQEEVMRAIFSVAGPIAEADARMLERYRTLQNTAYYEDMNMRLKGVIQETLSHIAGGYQIQATNIADITNRWKAKVAAQVQTYGIDVGAQTSKYLADLQYSLGKMGVDVQLEGLKIDSAKVLTSISDNAEASAYIWNVMHGNNISPGDWIDTWTNNWNEQG